MSITKKGILIGFCLLLLAGCGREAKQNAKEGTETQSAETQLTETKKDSETELSVDKEQQPIHWEMEAVEDVRRIDSHSAYATSFSEIVGTDKPVIYLGMPYPISVEEPKSYEWLTSDSSVATVKEGVVSGWKEGVVTILQRDSEGNELGTWEFAVTTFNDGKNVASGFELGKEAYVDQDIELTSTMDPEYLRLHINTIQDVIYYIQHSEFSYNPDAPVMFLYDSLWTWPLDGDLMIKNKCGVQSDLASVASYLLQNDFEDWGFVEWYGEDSYCYNWFYEDSTYYLMDFGQVLRDVANGENDKDYEPFCFKDYDEVLRFVQSRIIPDSTFLAFLVSAMGNEEAPVVSMSYMHDSSVVYSEHFTLAFEDDVCDAMKIAYQNDDFDFEIISVPTEEMPLGVPRYGVEKPVYYYEY